MKIDSSCIEMESHRRYASVTQKSVTASSARRTGSLSGGLGSLFGELISSGEDAQQSSQTASGGEAEENSAGLDDLATHFKNVTNPGRLSTRRAPESTMSTLRQRCMQFLMELLFGIRINDDGSYSWETGGVQLGGGRTYQVNMLTNSYYHREEESTSYATQGTVKTADGREIPFQLEFSMSRRFEEYYQETYATGVTYCDPLVINLDTNVAEVSDQKFYFDLDQDGTEEEISMLGQGSGFLALDVNGDGVINDGGELFGTKSGDGFSDLAAYDSDGNGWIDEADEIWSRLLIWTKDDQGNDKMYHLSDLGVGAIGLANISTQFAMNSAQDNRNNAMLRSTGIFLYENGSVSTVQHLDLAR